MKKNNKYKIVEFDAVHDIHLLKKKVFWFIYKTISVGGKSELEKYIKSTESIV